MKRLSKTISTFCCAFGCVAVAQEDPHFGRVLETYSSAYHSSLEKEPALRILSEWPGIKTMDGVRAIVKHLTKPDGAYRADAFAILERSQVPGAQIVSYLLEKTEAASEKEVGSLAAYYFLLTKFPDDDRVPKFFAAKLDDKRLPPPGPPGPRDEPTGSQTYRVGDMAFGSLIQVLVKRGEIKAGDPAYGDPGGEYSWNNRDRNITALKVYLYKAGFLSPALGN